MKALQKIILAIAIAIAITSMVLIMCAIACDPQYSDPKNVIWAVLAGIAGLSVSYLLSLPASRIQKVLDAEKEEKAAKKAARDAAHAQYEKDLAEAYAECLARQNH